MKHDNLINEIVGQEIKARGTFPYWLNLTLLALFLGILVIISQMFILPYLN